MMKNFLICFLCTCLLAVHPIKCDDNDCESEKDCDLCLLKSECSWCVENNSCNTKKRLIEKGCINIILDNSTHIVVNPNFMNIDNMNKSSVQLNLKTANITGSLNALDLKNAIITGSLDAPHKISFEYRPTKFYPTDFYILMDASESIPREFPPFSIDEQNLFGFRYGYGTFLRKPLLNDTLELNCEQSECEYPSYTFSHNLDFIANISKLQSNIDKTVRMASQNTSRFGMELFDQILICRDVIKWNITSRKYIVVVTDGYLNPFGESDGKSNGRKCLLENGKYNQNSNIPLEQILKDFFAEKFKIILAVTDNVKPEYDKIQIRFPRSIFVAELWKNNSNFQNIIISGYDYFTSFFGFENTSDECTNISYYFDCGNSTISSIDRSVCENVEYGKIYKCTAMIECNCGKFDNKEITITESTFGIDRFNLNIETDDLSQCSKWPAEKNEDDEDKDASCKDLKRRDLCHSLGECINGTCSCNEGYDGQYCEYLKCPTDSDGLTCGGPSNGKCEEGICVCEDHWEGEDCSVSISDKKVEDNNNENINENFNCQNLEDTKVCTGNGECINGNCSCNEEYYGQYCEYLKCPTDSDGLTCGGPSRGTCEEGTCVCEDNWEGENCSNSRPDDLIEDAEDDYIDEGVKCRDLETLEVCTGNGECINGNCSCNEEYYGQYCEYLKCSTDSDGLICGGPSRGTCEEGTCVCEDNWEGENCSNSRPDDLIEDAEDDYIDEEEKCRDLEKLEVCTGNGECINGNCSCNEEYYGQYCEYLKCPTNSDGLICGGPSRGTCEEGTCVCEDNWEGHDCFLFQITCSELEPCIRCYNTFEKCEEPCQFKNVEVTYFNSSLKNIKHESTSVCEFSQKENVNTTFTFSIQNGDHINVTIYPPKPVFNVNVVLGSLFFLFILLCLVVCFYIHRKRARERDVRNCPEAYKMVRIVK